MRRDQRILVELALELRGGPIRGQLRDEQGSEAGFVGWLELSTMLERIRGSATTEQNDSDRDMSNKS